MLATEVAEFLLQSLTDTHAIPGGLAAARARGGKAAARSCRWNAYR
jgi:hypothetical protein